MPDSDQNKLNKKLMRAFRNKDTPKIRELVNYEGANVNYDDGRGPLLWQALMRAQKGEACVRLISTLLALGADISCIEPRINALNEDTFELFREKLLDRNLSAQDEIILSRLHRYYPEDAPAEDPAEAERQARIKALAFLQDGIIGNVITVDIGGFLRKSCYAVNIPYIEYKHSHFYILEDNARQVFAAIITVMSRPELMKSNSIFQHARGNGNITNSEISQFIKRFDNNDARIETDDGKIYIHFGSDDVHIAAELLAQSAHILQTDSLEFASPEDRRVWEENLSAVKNLIKWRDRVPLIGSILTGRNVHSPELKFCGTQTGDIKAAGSASSTQHGLPDLPTAERNLIAARYAQARAERILQDVRAIERLKQDFNGISLDLEMREAAVETGLQEAEHRANADHLQQHGEIRLPDDFNILAPYSSVPAATSTANGSDLAALRSMNEVSSSSDAAGTAQHGTPAKAPETAPNPQA